MRRFLIAAMPLVLLGAAETHRDQLLAIPFSSLLAEASFQPVTSVSDLPPAVADALDVNGTFSMADPGESWNPSCIHDAGNPEPDRRLIIAISSPHLVGVHYERGGVSRHSALELFQLGSRGDLLTRCLYTSSIVAKSVEEVRAAFPHAFIFFHCKPSPSAGLPPNKALQRTANSAFQSGLVAFRQRNPGVPASSGGLLAAAERPFRWAAKCPPLCLGSLPQGRARCEQPVAASTRAVCARAPRTGAPHGDFARASRTGVALGEFASQRSGQGPRAGRQAGRVPGSAGGAGCCPTRRFSGLPTARSNWASGRFWH